MPPSSAPIRAGRASACCGAGPRPWCGRSRPSRPRSARSSPRSRRCTAKGHFALARALLALGDRAGAQAHVREAWRNEALSIDLEDQVMDTFKELLTPADHKARMDMRFYVEDVDAGLRAANRVGPTARGDRQGLGGGDQEGPQCAGPAGGGAGRGGPRSRLHFRPRPVAAARGQGRRRRGIDPVGAAGCRAADQCRPMVGGAPAAGAQAARPRRRPDRLSHRPRRRPAQQGSIPLGATVHRRLDRVALPRRSRDRDDPLRQGGAGQRQSDHPCAGRILAGPRRRGAGPQGGGARLLRGRGASRDRLLRPAGAGAARLQGHRAAAAARALAGAARRRRPARCRARDRAALRRRRARSGGAVRRRSGRAVDRYRGPGRARRDHRPQQGCALHACSSARPRSARGYALEHYAFPTFGIPEYRGRRSRGRSQPRLCDRPAGKHLLPGRRFEREGGGADAGDARKPDARPPRNSA